MPRSPRRFLFSAVFLVVTIAVYFFFGLYLLLGLILANILCWALAPLARKRGWGAEGRLTRYLSRPPIADETRRVSQPTPRPPRTRFN